MSLIGEFELLAFLAKYLNVITKILVTCTVLSLRLLWYDDYILPLGVEIILLEGGFNSFKTVIAEADLSWRILESGLRLFTSIADAHRSFPFLASLCLCFFSSFWAMKKLYSTFKYLQLSGISTW